MYKRLIALFICALLSGCISAMDPYGVKSPGTDRLPYTIADIN